jgi:hypothetical protein
VRLQRRSWIIRLQKFGKDDPSALAGSHAAGNQAPR